MSPSSMHVSKPRAIAWSAVALGALLMSTSCSGITGGEVTEAACLDSNGLDDEDGDGLINCADPDCFSFEVCRREALSNDHPEGGLPGTGGSAGHAGSAGASSGASGVGGMSPAGGSGGNDGPMSSYDAGYDASIDDLLDAAGPLPDAEVIPCGGCAVGEECIDDECVPTSNPTGGNFIIRVLSGSMPLAMPGNMCIDLTCVGGGSPVAFCPCPPDPYVRVLRLRGEEIDVVFVSNVVNEALRPTFDADREGMVELEAGDVLVFEMWDKNTVAADTQVYSCRPDLSDLKSGPLECQTLSGGFGTETHGINAEIEAAPQ